MRLFVLLSTPEFDVNTTDLEGRSLLYRMSSMGPFIKVIVRPMPHLGNDLDLDSTKLDDEDFIFPFKCELQSLAPNLSPLIKALLEHPDIDVNRSHSNGTTPLRMAITSGQLDTVKMLLSHKDILLDAKDENGWTPLFLAAKHSSNMATRNTICCFDIPDEIRNAPLDKRNQLMKHWFFAREFSSSIDAAYYVGKVVDNLISFLKWLQDKKIAQGSADLLYVDKRVSIDAEIINLVLDRLDSQQRARGDKASVSSQLLWVAASYRSPRIVNSILNKTSARAEF